MPRGASPATPSTWRRPAAHLLRPHRQQRVSGDPAPVRTVLRLEEPIGLVNRDNGSCTAGTRSQSVAVGSGDAPPADMARTGPRRLVSSRRDPAAHEIRSNLPDKPRALRRRRLGWPTSSGRILASRVPVDRSRIHTAQLIRTTGRRWAATRLAASSGGHHGRADPGRRGPGKACLGPCRVAGGAPYDNGQRQAQSHRHGSGEQHRSGSRSTHPCHDLTPLTGPDRGRRPEEPLNALCPTHP